MDEEMTLAPVCGGCNVKMIVTNRGITCPNCMAYFSINTEVYRNLKSLLPEDSQTQCGYGIFSLRPDHPFTRACMLHDAVFADKENKIPTEGRKAADRDLLKRMLLIAKANNSRWLKVQAYLFYGLARVFGKVMW